MLTLCKNINSIIINCVPTKATRKLMQFKIHTSLTLAIFNCSVASSSPFLALFRTVLHLLASLLAPLFAPLLAPLLASLLACFHPHFSFCSNK